MLTTRRNSIKTRIQMYKSYKNLRNGKIRLCRGSSYTSSEESHCSQSKKLSEESVSGKDSRRSSNDKNIPQRTKKRFDYKNSQSKSLNSENERSEIYDSDFIESVKSTRNVSKSYRFTLHSIIKTLSSLFLETKKSSKAA